MRREPLFGDAPDFEAAETDANEDLRPLGPPKPFRRLRLAARFVCAAGAIAGLSFLAQQKPDAGEPQRAWIEPPPRPEATATASRRVSETPLLTLSGAGTGAGKTEAPRWNPATGLREDALSQGSFDAIEAPYLRVVMTDAGGAAPPEGGLFVTLARRGADGAGLAVARTGEGGRVESKFGPVETLAATLSGEGTRHCTGFRGLWTGPVRIEGWLCGILGQAPQATALTCALDDLGLAGEATPALAIFFSEAETRRTASCRLREAATPDDATGSIPSTRPVAASAARRDAAQMRQKAKARP